VDAEVKKLLALKADFKAITGSDWKPGVSVPSSPAPAPAAASAPADSGAADEILAKVAAQGDKVRQLKAAKASKAEIDAEVKILLSLKAEYKNLTGKDVPPPGQAPKQPAQSVSSIKSRSF